MELIERYLQAVGRQLPLKNRNDILAELRSNLTDALESRGAGEADEDQVVALLKEFGPPEKVAASYYPEGQYLVGPALFPAFRSAVGITLLVVVIVHLVLTGVLVIFAGDFLAALDILGQIFGVAFAALGVVTLVFYILQRTGVKSYKLAGEWDPQQLPELDTSEEVKRGELIVGIIFSLVFLTIFLALRDGFRVISTPGGESWTVVNPVLTQYLPLIVLSLAIGIGVDIYLLGKGRWTTSARLVKIASNLFSLVVLGLLIAAHQAWLQPYTGGQFMGFVEKIPELTENPQQFTQLMLMQGFWIGLVVAFIVEAVETVVMGVRLVQRALENR
jgi:hypothetical protein